MATRSHAPGDLALVLRFLRTRKTVTDGPTLATWLRQERLGRTANDALGHRALRLREALRELMWANNGGPPAADASDAVNAEARRVKLETRVTPDGKLAYTWNETGAEAFLGHILAAILAAMADESWARLKACAADDCRYAFYDHSKNRSGRWCDVAGCGVNFRMRAYRRREAAGRRTSEVPRDR